MPRKEPKKKSRSSPKPEGKELYRKPGEPSLGKSPTLQWLSMLECRVTLSHISEDERNPRPEHVFLNILFIHPDSGRIVQNTRIRIYAVQGSGQGTYNTTVMSDWQSSEEEDILTAYLEQIRDLFGEDFITNRLTSLLLSSGTNQITKSSVRERLDLEKEQFKTFMEKSYQFKIMRDRNSGTAFWSKERNQALCQAIIGWKRRWACSECFKEYEEQEKIELIHRQPYQEPISQEPEEEIDQWEKWRRGAEQASTKKSSTPRKRRKRS